MDIGTLALTSVDPAALALAQRPDAANARHEMETLLFATLLRASNLFSGSQAGTGTFGMGMYEEFMVHELAAELAAQHTRAYGRALLDGIEGN